MPLTYFKSTCLSPGTKRNSISAVQNVVNVVLEQLAMAGYLSISTKEFLKSYTRSVNGKIAFLENPRNYDCILAGLDVS